MKRRQMMTQHEIELASARLQHWWELHGSGSNPTQAIRQIVREIAPPGARHQLEEHLRDFCAQLFTLEGGDDDYAL